MMASWSFLASVAFGAMATTAHWTRHDNHPMLKGNDQMAVGYYNQTIYLLYVQLIHILSLCTRYISLHRSHSEEDPMSRPK